MAIVYRHRRLDTFDVFYIGIGKKEYRSKSKHNRSNNWKNIVNKYGYSIEIVAKEIDYESAKELEILLIKEYGRKIDKSGNLVNITEGGEGSLGISFKHSKETRFKMNKEKEGIPRTKEEREKISLNHAKSKLVINILTNEEFRSCAEASRVSGINQNTLSEKLRGQRKNNTDFKYK